MGMNDYKLVKEYIFVEHRGESVSPKEVADALQLSLREVLLMFDNMVQERLLKRSTDLENPNALIGVIEWDS